MNGMIKVHSFGYSIHTSMNNKINYQFLSNSDKINAFEINQFANFVFEIHGAL